MHYRHLSTTLSTKCSHDNFLQSPSPAGSLSYLEALTRGRHSAIAAQQCQRLDVQTTSSPSQLSSEEQILLLGQDQASRPSSGGGGGGSRGRSVSFSLPSSAASPLPSSPPRWREHASEAGSPTLEQVLLMSRHSPATPSPAEAGYGSLSQERTTRSSSPQPTSSSSPSPTSLPSSMARLTMADVVGIDVAVAQAAQTLQQLQQQQAALYGGMGGMYLPQYYPQQAGDQLNQTHPMLGSIHQQNLRPGQQNRDPLALERAARLYRSAASVCEVSQVHNFALLTFICLLLSQFNVQSSGFMHLVWPTASPLLHRRTKLLLLHQDLPWGSALGHFGADIGPGMHELS